MGDDGPPTRPPRAVERGCQPWVTGWWEWWERRYHRAYSLLLLLLRPSTSPSGRDTVGVATRCPPRRTCPIPAACEVAPCCRLGRSSRRWTTVVERVPHSLSAPRRDRSSPQIAPPSCACVKRKEPEKGARAGFVQKCLLRLIWRKDNHEPRQLGGREEEGLFFVAPPIEPVHVVLHTCPVRYVLFRLYHHEMRRCVRTVCATHAMSSPRMTTTPCATPGRGSAEWRYN